MKMECAIIMFRRTIRKEGFNEIININKFSYAMFKFVLLLQGRSIHKHKSTIFLYKDV